jgi:ComF family protein
MELIFPPQCILCRGGSPLPICLTCQSTFQYVKPPYCQCCGTPRTGSDGDPLCADCRNNPPSYDLIRSACIYGGTAKKAITAYKFHGRRKLSSIFSGLLVDMLRRESIEKDVDLICAVPLHRDREKVRGYNQAALLSDIISRETGIRNEATLLIRTRRTDTMNRLKRGARFRNMENAFSVTDNNLVRGKKVLMVDDIITTGATLHECAKTLKDAGALRVYGATIARTLSKAGD